MSPAGSQGSALPGIPGLLTGNGQEGDPPQTPGEGGVAPGAAPPSAAQSTPALKKILGEGSIGSTPAAVSLRMPAALQELLAVGAKLDANTFTIAKEPAPRPLLTIASDQEGLQRLGRATRAYHALRPHLQLHADGRADLVDQFAILDQMLGFTAPAAPPEALPEPPVGWNDPEEVIQAKVERTFRNPRFVSISSKKKRGEHYLWLGPRDYRPLIGQVLSVRPNPDEKIGGFVLWGDYNRKGYRLG